MGLTATELLMTTLIRVLRFLRLLGLGILGLILLLLGGALVVSTAREAATLETRRVAFAATATRLASIASAGNPGAVTPARVTPTPLPSPIPTVEDLRILPTPTPVVTLLAGQPTRTPLLPQQNAFELVNFLVVGTDQRDGSRAYRTDVILIVSVNWTTQTVNLLSIPRDLYVYIPGWGMDRINTAELHQTQTEVTHHRLGLLAETIEYNLGIRVDHIARVNFEGFETLIDMVGGVEVPVDCPVSGYQLDASGTSYVPFVLEPGVHTLSGDMALWYVRQRMDSSDFDRNRRQQVLLRALVNKVREVGLIEQLPQLWGTLTSIVATDLTLDQALMYIPLFLQLDSTKMESHFLGLDEVNLWQAPNGASVLVIDPQPFARTLDHFLSPPTQNQLYIQRHVVEIVNASTTPSASQLLAAQLEWAGMLTRIGTPSASVSPQTQIYDHTGQTKDSGVEVLKETLGLTNTIPLLSQPESSGVDFTVVIGDDYRSCRTSPWLAFSQPE